MNKCKVILVFIIFTSSGLFYQANDSNQLAWQEVDIPVLKNDIPVNFMAVLNDKNFTDYGFPGNGTADNPYRIENITIPFFENGNGILVVGTTKHFIIQNCDLKAYWNAIFLENVAPGTAIIQNNYCLASEVGIGVLKSNNITIRENELVQNPYGIFVQQSNHSLIINNTCIRTDQNGIRTQWSEYNNITLNHCTDDFNVLIEVYYDSHASITHNICDNSLRGILCYATESVISDNILRYGSQHGLWLINVDNSLISNNLIEFNKDGGCVAENTDNSIFIGNYIANNSNYGLLLNKYSSNNSVYHNSFIGNNPGGTSQAKDNGEVGSNKWYNQDLKEGNYWSDWQKSKPYPLDGKAESVDKYPLNVSLERLDFKFSYFLISLLFIGLAAILKRNFFHNLT